MAIQYTFHGKRRLYNRHIPFKLKDKLKEELSKLEKIGIISKKVLQIL